jgi:hypothetical protein
LENAQNAFSTATTGLVSDVLARQCVSDVLAFEN